MTDQEFDRYLSEIADVPPPADLTEEFTPWRSAMNRILWGTGLTTITLNFLALDVILPAIGWMMLLLGYRTLRNENRWFRLGYCLCWVRIVWWLVTFAINATVFAGEPEVQQFLRIVSYVMILPAFLFLLALRNSIRSVQNKVGLPLHGGNGMLVWFLLTIVFAAYRISGLSAWALMISYGFLFKNLCALPKELEEAGYAVSPAPVRLSDSALKWGYTGIMVLSLIVGYTCFSKYPMDFLPASVSESQEVQQVRRELTALGFPEHILDDMTPDDILTCKGALRVKVEINDQPINDGREVWEKEGTMTYITTVYDQKELRLTHIAVELPGETETWQIIHHFHWVIDPGFCGTESLQLWPPYQQTEGWAPAGEPSGQVLYTDNGTVYASSYHSLEAETYTTDSIFWGQRSTTDIFAAFSLPNGVENQRGYVSYTVTGYEDGHSLNAWTNYTHQTMQLQYPVVTAREDRQTSGFSDSICFRTVQDALQFYP